MQKNLLTLWEVPVEESRFNSNDAQSGRQRLLTVATHTTHHAGPLWATQQVGMLQEALPFLLAVSPRALHHRHCHHRAQRGVKGAALHPDGQRQRTHPQLWRARPIPGRPGDAGAGVVCTRTRRFAVIIKKYLQKDILLKHGQCAIQ